MQSPAPESKLKITFKPDTNLVLKAGAGAGKTTTLIRLFFEQVDYYRKTHQKWPRLVLTTFTRKATQEIRERLMTEALQRGEDEIFHWLQSKYYVQISTIHGVLSQFLSRYGDRLGLPTDFQLVDEDVINKSKKSVLRKIFDRNPESIALLEEFSFIEVLKIVRKFQSVSSFNNIERLAAAELENEFKLEIEKWRKLVLEFVSLAKTESLSEKWAQFVDFYSVVKTPVLDLKQSISRLEVLAGNSPSKPPHTSGKSKVTDNFNELADQLKKDLKILLAKKLSLAGHLMVYERMSVALEQICLEFKKDWRDQQSRHGQITMEDLETLSAEILKDYPESGTEFAKTWDYWMIDEYQDTSPLQVFLLDALRGQQNHFVVGDPQQSIYLFRGARSEVFQQKISEVEDSGGEFHRQLVNYRSRKEVLEMMNLYFAETSQQFEAMSVGSAVTHPEVPALIVYPGAPVDENQEADPQWSEKAALSRIQELLQTGVHPEEICVLSRNHKNLKNLARLAEQFQIPYYLHSSGNYYRQREVKDALHLLRFIDNPHDNVNFVGLLRTPWFLKKDEEIIGFCEGQSFWLTAAQKAPQDKLILNLQLALEEKDHLGDLAVFKKWLIQSQMLDSAKALDPSGQREANLWKLIYLCEKEESKGHLQISDFYEKAQKLNADSSGEDREPAAVVEPSRVQLMTIHASKGLQFPHILLLGFGDDSKSPHVDSWTYSEQRKKWALSLRDLETGDKLTTPLAIEVLELQKEREAQESERLLYVAMTRAQDSVSLVWSQIRKNSWAAKFPWDYSEGIKTKKDFIYEVRQTFTLNANPEIQVAGENKIRPEWLASKNEKQSSVSVTAILNQISAKKKSAESFALPDFEKSKKGQRVHRIFESLKYDADLSKSLHGDPESQKAIDFTLNLKHPPMRELLPISHVEWGFTVPWQQSKLLGQIDMWAYFQNRLWVIDYKTGSPKSAEKSLQQLQIYAECLYRTKRAPPGTPVVLCALYPLDEKIFLQEFANRAELVRGSEILSQVE